MVLNLLGPAALQRLDGLRAAWALGPGLTLGRLRPRRSGPRRLILHIGLHKTGTTAVQNAYHFYSDRYLVALPLADPNHSTAMIAIFSARRDRYHGFRQSGLDAAGVAALGAREGQQLDRFLAAGDRDVLISAESLSSILTTPEAVSAFLARTGAAFDRVEAIAYLRPARSYMSSAFQQRVKGANLSAPVASTYPAYRTRLGPWAEVMGEAFQLAPYRRDLLREGDVVADFAHRMGLPRPRPGRPANESLSAEATAALFALFTACPPAPGKVGALRVGLLRRVAPGFGAGRFTLARRLVDPVVAGRAEDLAWAEAATGISLDDTDAPDGPFAGPEDLLAEGLAQMPAFLEYLAGTRMMPAAWIAEFRAGTQAMGHGPAR